MGEAVEMVTALVSPIEKLLDIVHNAIGTAYKPIHTRKMADAKAYEIKQIASAICASIDIPTTYNNGNIFQDSTDFDDLIKRTQNRLIFQEINKQKNIESVVDQAYQELEDQSPVTGTPLNTDWILRFFNSIQDVSNIDMQALWAKILAGEIKQPSTYSFRTLTILHDLSCEDAATFQKICNYVIAIDGNVILPAYDTLLEAAEISDIELIRLSEYGLINAPTQLYVGVPLENNDTVIARNDIYVIVGTYAGIDEYDLSIPHYALTKVGCEIFTLFQSNITNEYFFNFAKEIKNSVSEIDGVKVAAYSILSVENEIIEYEDSVDLIS